MVLIHMLPSIAPIPVVTSSYQPQTSLSPFTQSHKLQTSIPAMLQQLVCQHIVCKIMSTLLNRDITVVWAAVCWILKKWCVWWLWLFSYPYLHTIDCLSGSNYLRHFLIWVYYWETNIPPLQCGLRWLKSSYKRWSPMPNGLIDHIYLTDPV